MWKQLIALLMHLERLETIKVSMEQHALKNVNNCLNTNIYFYLETTDI
jgi:hypothetical protein